MRGRANADRLKPMVLPLTLCVAVVLVVILGLQLRSVRSELRAQWRVARLPSVGQVVPPVVVVTLAGDTLVLGDPPPGTRQVLFVFNTTCAFCLETLPAWNRIAARLYGDSEVTVLWWSQHSDSLTLLYVAERAIRAPVIVGVTRRYLRLFRAEAVPATMVIGSDGGVLFGTAGVLSPAAEDSVVRAARSTG
jgi:hypothetical protein